MAADKVSEVRRHILGLLEGGQLEGGDKLPGARAIAEETGVSFLKVQQGLDSLAKDGVLQIQSRSGTYVQACWRERLLPENMSIFNALHRLPWVRGLLQILREELPEIRATHSFPRGMLELKTTLHVQKNCADYADLSGWLAECYPDRDEFFRPPFEPFYREGRLIGIPFIFSPRVMFFNPEPLLRCGCELPQRGWEWKDFVRMIRQLLKHLPANRIFNLHYQPHLWINFVMRAGGRLMRPDADDPVGIDSPQTRRGLELFSELCGLLKAGGACESDEYVSAFCRGEAAFMLSDRQFCNRLRHRGWDGWQTAPLPLIPGGEDISTQATDLLCVRKDCTDPQLAKDYIRLMLSARVQDYIAGEQYGIPIRKSAAFKSLNLSDARDALFATEMGKISADYNLFQPHLAGLITSGIARMFQTGAPVEEATAELAQMARTYLRLQRYNAEQAV